jgi:hypothetical protein
MAKKESGLAAGFFLCVTAITHFGHGICVSRRQSQARRAVCPFAAAYLEQKNSSACMNLRPKRRDIAEIARRRERRRKKISACGRYQTVITCVGRLRDSVSRVRALSKDRARVRSRKRADNSRWCEFSGIITVDRPSMRCIVFPSPVVLRALFSLVELVTHLR